MAAAPDSFQIWRKMQQNSSLRVLAAASAKISLYFASAVAKYNDVDTDRLSAIAEVQRMRAWGDISLSTYFVKARVTRRSGYTVKTACVITEHKSLSLSVLAPTLCAKHLRTSRFLYFPTFSFFFSVPSFAVSEQH